MELFIVLMQGFYSEVLTDNADKADILILMQTKGNILWCI